MGIVVVGLIVLVVYMAAKTPMTNQPSSNVGRQIIPDNSDMGWHYADLLGTDTNVPALGVTGTISPAMTGGRPAMSRANHLRLDMAYDPVDGVSDAGLMTGVPPGGSDPGVFGNMTNASSDGGYKREDPRPQVAPTITTNLGTKFHGFKF